MLAKIEAKYKPFSDDLEVNARVINTKIKEFTSSYPFLKPIFDQCFLLDKQVFGVTENGLLKDSIITKRLISAIIRTGLDPLLGTIDFPDDFIEILRQNDYIQSTIAVETSLKAINDKDHNIGDEIITTAAKKLFKTIFNRYYQTNTDEQERVNQLDKNPELLPLEYIPPEFRKFLLFHRNGTKLFLELTKAKPENEIEKKNLSKLNVYFHLINNIPVELGTQEPIDEYATTEKSTDINSKLIILPIVFEGHEINIFSSPFVLNPQNAEKVLERYNFLRARPYRGEISEEELLKRYGDLYYILNVIKEFKKLDLNKLQQYLKNMIHDEIATNHEQIFTAGTQEFLMDTWTDSKRGLQHCNNYLKVVTTQIDETQAKINSNSNSQNVTNLLSKLHLLKSFFETLIKWLNQRNLPKTTSSI